VIDAQGSKAHQLFLYSCR